MDPAKCEQVSECPTSVTCTRYGRLLAYAHTTDATPPPGLTVSRVLTDVLKRRKIFDFSMAVSF